MLCFTWNIYDYLIIFVLFLYSKVCKLLNIIQCLCFLNFGFAVCLFIMFHVKYNYILPLSKLCDVPFCIICIFSLVRTPVSLEFGLAYSVWLLIDLSSDRLFSLNFLRYTDYFGWKCMSDSMFHVKHSSFAMAAIFHFLNISLPD